MDITDIIASSVWSIASIDDEPEIVLTDWTVFGVISGLWPDKTRHFVGYNASDREGRVSSAIVKFDAEKAVGLTRSGRIYRLKGKQGSGSPDGLHVWALWCRRNEVSETDKITVEHL